MSDFPYNTKYEHTFTVNIGSNTTMRQFFLDKNSPVKGFDLMYIKTRRAGANRKSLQGTTIVADSVFDASFLVIKVKQTEVINQVPLEHIETATEQVPSEGYPIFLKDIDWEQSFVQVADGVTLTANTVWEFTVTFKKK